MTAMYLSQEIATSYDVQCTSVQAVTVAVEVCVCVWGGGEVAHGIKRVMGQH
jgi:hypothetical protein